MAKAKPAKAAPKAGKVAVYIEKSSTSRVYIQVKEYRGKERLDIREFFLRGRDTDDEKTPDGCFDDAKGGVWQFTGKGVSLDAEMLDELVKKVTELAA